MILSYDIAKHHLINKFLLIEHFFMIPQFLELRDVVYDFFRLY